MKKLAIIICLIGCVYLASAKETIYVKYEPTSCVQQYYYKSATNSGNGIVSEYFDYHVNLTSNEKTVVRSKKVGTYKKSDYSLTKNLINCDNKKTHTFQSLTGKIATGEKEVFFIEEVGDSYHIYKGMSASYEIYNSKYFYSHSPEYSFRYIYNRDYAPSEKLKEDSGSGVTTLFAGTDTKGCNRQFGIVQMPEHACSTQVSKEYLKDIGLYIEKNGDGFFILKQIDRMLLSDYLKWRCSGFRTDLNPNNNRPTEYNQLTGNNTAKGGNVQNYNQQSNPNTEVVASYNNGSHSSDGNTVKGGVSIPTQYSETTTQNTGAFIIATYEGNAKEPITKSKPLNGEIIPTGYDAVATKGGNSVVQPLKGRHVIVKGDTLYSLSKKYGASIDELKAWNNLADNTISIGDTFVVDKSAFVF